MRASQERRGPGRARALVAVVVIAGLAAAGWESRGTVWRSLPPRHCSRAEQMLAAGDEALAASELGFALESDPLHPAARRLLGELQLRQHRLEDAFLCLQSYTDAFPDDPEGWSALAEGRQQASQPDEAEAALTNAVGRAPDRADLLQRRADLRYRRGGVPCVTGA